MDFFVCLSSRFGTENLLQSLILRTVSGRKLIIIGLLGCQQYEMLGTFLN